MNWDAVGHDLAIVLTLLLLEAVLSFDNAAILAAMVRRLPPKDRRKALLYGLGGAYILRITAILLASFLIETPSLKILGGAYLLFISVRHFIRLARHRQDGHKEHAVKPGLLARWGVPALVSIIVQIELIDLAFAVDQVIVAVAFTDEILLIIAASVIGILFLRLAAAVIARVMDWLPALEHMAYVAVGYVGFKLILLHPFFAVGWTQGAATPDGLRTSIEGGACRVPFIPVEHEVAVGAMPGCEIPTAVSVAITLSLFLVPVALKLLFGKRGLPPKEPETEVDGKATVPPAPEPEA